MTGRTLDDIRADIDRLDRDEIMPLLARRLSLARQVGSYKDSTSTPIVDRERERKVLYSFTQYMSDNGMPPECGVTMARALIDAAIIMERGGSAEKGADVEVE